AERELLQEEWKTQRLETENQNLRQENKELKVSKNLLEDIQEVITEKEVSSLNKRLDELREARMASKRGYEPKRSK
ncbi:MobV family relaxase, partial [Streptococcus pyogenes]